MERCRQKDNQENAAKLFLSETENSNSSLNFNDTINSLKEKINKENQNVLYYSGGLRALSTLFDNGKSYRIAFKYELNS